MTRLAISAPMALRLSRSPRVIMPIWPTTSVWTTPCGRFPDPEHLGQDGEGSLDLGQVDARGVAVRRDLLGRPDDRFGAAHAHATQDEAEQLPHLAAAPVRDG